MIFLDQTFKTIQIACYILGKETDDTRTYRFLLPKILASHTDQLPTKGKMNEHLESLYGAYFKTGVERIGDLHLMHMTLTIVHPDLVRDQNLFLQALMLFKDVLNQDRTISSTIFEEEKRLYIEQHKSMSDRKRTYANYKFNQYFFKNDIYEKPLYGGLKSLRESNHEGLMKTWQNIMKEDMFFTVCHGPLSMEEKVLVESVMPSSNGLFEVPKFSFRKPKKEVLKVVEHTDMKQAVIKMGYILPIFRHDALYEAAILFDTILGGFPESKLFKIIREEKGLCYDVYSNYDSYRGVLMITSGVDKANDKEAISGIKHVVQNMMNLIDQDDLIHAKKYYIHQLKVSLDSQSTGTKRAFIRKLLHLEDTMDDKINKILSVTLEEIQQVFQLLTLDTVYVLKGASHEEN